MTDITAIGEILIDLTQQGVNEKGIPQYSANPGGAPANLVVAAAKLGASTAFIGKVGRDSFGLQLTRCLLENGVDVSRILTDPIQHTTLAVVSLDSCGERSFTFYRSPSADTNLNREEIPDTALQNTRFFHFGSVSLTAEPAKSATLSAVASAKAHGAVITYDPNYRDKLWPSEKEAVSVMLSAMHLADILKVSDEELLLLTGTSDPSEGTAMLASSYGISLIFVTMGAKGAFYRCKAEIGYVPGVSCTVADTNGAGDTFFGAALSRLAKLPSLDHLTPELLTDILYFANKAASLTTSRPGAIPAMPTLDEVMD